ncbi:MFS transporter [Streptomyces sp. NPDC086182]|uniref:MFS transporter n=1 Tax=Streptomyces sp. NPDC086182 TaxID=3155058 RepID=UPI00341F12CE
MQPVAARPDTDPGHRPRRALPALCATQITSWGIVYYAFPVLNPQITRDTGWPPGATTAAFSLALIASALTGIPVGRVIDRHGPRLVMTAGSVLATVALLLIAAAPNLLCFTAGWLLAGTAMAAILYQPAFTALTRWWAPRHVRALTYVTLAGGLASTLFAPITAALSAHLSWRATYAVLALLLAAITVPAHAIALNAPWPRAHPSTAKPSATTAAHVEHTRTFWILAGALTLSALATYAVVIALVPLLIERGYTTSQAAWALGLGGAGQTLGRTLYARLAGRTSPARRATALMALGGAATVALALTSGPYALIVALSLTAGMVRGNLTLLQATAVTDRWGAADYGRLSGILGAPVTAASAVAPFASAVLAGPVGGYAPLFLALASLAFVASVLSCAT